MLIYEMKSVTVLELLASFCCFVDVQIMCNTEEDLPEIEIAQSLMECGLCKHAQFAFSFEIRF